MAARAVQGAGAALVAPAALALLVATEPEGARRTRALAVWTAAAAGGGASGWVLGGAISGGLGWEWVFAVNVPVGLAGAALAGRLLPESREPGAARLDVRGALALTAGVGAVLLGLSRGEAEGLAAVATLVPLAAGLALLALFAAIERRAPAPLLPPGALRAPGLARAASGRRWRSPARPPRRCSCACCTSSARAASRRPRPACCSRPSTSPSSRARSPGRA